MAFPPTRTLLLAAVVLVSGQQAAAADTTYEVDARKSSILVHVGKEGLFSFAGHEHLVKVPWLQGKVRAAADDVSRCLVTLRFSIEALRVEEKGEPAGDAAKVQETMLGTRVLDASRFPTASFESRTVTGRATAPGSYELTLIGDFSLHGVTRSVTLPVRVAIRADSLVASGKLVLRQTDYGIRPITVAGVVKVKDELTIEYTLAATKTTR